MNLLLLDDADFVAADRVLLRDRRLTHLHEVHRAESGDSLRVAVGLDYRDAAPVSGRRVGFGEARMTVEATVALLDP